MVLPFLFWTSEDWKSIKWLKTTAQTDNRKEGTQPDENGNLFAKDRSRWFLEKRMLSMEILPYRLTASLPKPWNRACLIHSPLTEILILRNRRWRLLGTYNTWHLSPAPRPWFWCLVESGFVLAHWLKNKGLNLLSLALRMGTDGLASRKELSNCHWSAIPSSMCD